MNYCNAKFYADQIFFEQMNRKRYRNRLINPPPTTAGVRRSMAANRARNTTPEVSLRRALRTVGVRGYRLHLATVAGRPDLSFFGQRVAVFVNGCFWHRCPQCALPLPKNNRMFWITKFRRNRLRDRRKERLLTNAGWRVMFLWECDIKRNPVGAAQRVVRLLERRPPKTC